MEHSQRHALTNQRISDLIASLRNLDNTISEIVESLEVYKSKREELYDEYELLINQAEAGGCE